MTERDPIPRVGVPDPELKSSPIVDQGDDMVALAELESGSGVCYFNGVSYPADHYVCSGDELLRCENGVWVRKGSCFAP